MSYDDARYSEQSSDSEDSWNSSDSEELGFLTGTHDAQGLDGYDTRAPVRVRATVARPCFCGETHDFPPGPRYLNNYRHHCHYSLPRHKCESDLAFKIRKCQWKDVRELLGPRAMAAGAAGVRLAADASDADTTGKGKGKASKKGGEGKQTGASHVEKNTPDFFDLSNAITLRAPPDVLLALLAVAPSEALRHRWGAQIKDAETKNNKTRAAKDKDREAREPQEMEPDENDLEGCSLLHVAMLCPHETARHLPTPVQVVRRLCQLDPEAVVSKSESGYTPMYVLARFGVATKEADSKTAHIVDLLAKVSEDPTLLAKTSGSLLAEARGGAATLVSRLVRVHESDDENAGHARAYPLHAACVRHHGQTVRALLRAYPEAAAFKVEPPTARSRGGAQDPEVPNPRPLKDRSPGFPVHLLLTAHERGLVPDLATFKAVLDAYPDAAKQPAWGRAGRRHLRTPAYLLHALCSQDDSPVRLVKCLLKTVPETARIVERGETALHCALDSEALAPENRDRVRDRDPGIPPAAVEIARAVLRAYPAAAAASDREGAFPAHVAVNNKWPPGLVVEVLRAFPDAGTKKGPRDGMFPLHQATRDGNVETVKEIVAAFPRLAREASEEDGLPLHVAARHSAPDAVTRALLESYPMGARKVDGEGELPLHAVCAALGSDDLMYETSEAETENDRRDYENAKLLYAAFPEGAFHTDARGKIPAERLPMYDIHRMLSRDVFGGDAWRGEGWRIMGGEETGGASQAAHASGAALLVRVAANELAVAAMSAGEIERLTVALDRARAAVSKETLRRPFEEALLAEHDRDEKWMCPIGYGLFRDPVRAGDGHVYERSNIVKWQEKSGAIEPRAPWSMSRGEPSKRAWKSPMTGLKCHDFALAPAEEIRKQIDEKLDEMMHAERAKKTNRDGGDGDGEIPRAAAKGKAANAKGKARAAPRGAADGAADGTADGTGPARGAKRAAEGAPAPAARARRARR
jgi:hypothetical protein